MLTYVVVCQNICTCTTFFNVCQGTSTEGSFTECNTNGLFVLGKATVRYLYGGIQLNCGHALTFFTRVSNVHASISNV